MKKVDRANCEIAQFKNAINNIRFDNKTEYDLEWIFERTSSSDKKILPTKYIQWHHPELVNNNVMDVTLKDYNVFKILSDKKASLDFLSNCIPDKQSETCKPISPVVEKHYDALNVFSDPRYELPNLLVRLMLNVYRSCRNIENPSDKNGISRFHVACMANDVETIKVYLDNGVVIDHTVSNDSPHFPGYTPLHFAVKCCSVQTVKVLLERNANICLKDAKGMSALHVLLKNCIEYAVISQRRAVLKSNERGWHRCDTESYMLSHNCWAEDYLWEKSQDMIILFLTKYNQEKICMDDVGLSYLHVACALGDTSLITSKNVADINKCVNADSMLWPGYSPLHFAALVSEIYTMEKLVEIGGDIGVKDAKGVTPLDICAETSEIEDIVKLLSLNPTWKNIMFSDGKTNLLNFVAAIEKPYNFERFVKKLLKNFDIHIPHDSPLWPGFTLMHLVVVFSKNFDNPCNPNYHEFSEMISNITRRSPKSLYVQNSNVSTPLDLAFRRKKTESVRDLLASYTSLEYYLESTSDSRLSCLHVASATNDYSLVQQLLSWGNSVNVVYNGEPFDSANSGWTPLHFAVANHSHSAVEILCRHGANVLARDANGMTPLHLSLVFADCDRYNGQKYKCTIDSLFSLANFEDLVVDGIGLSHLHVACFYGLETAITKLVRNGAEMNKAINCKASVGGRSTILANLAKYDGSTPLHLALRKYNKDDVKLLLQLVANVFIKSRKSKNLMCDILERSPGFTYNLDHIFFSLLSHSDDLQKRVEKEIGLTRLHVVCLTNDVALAQVEELLDRGADVNAQIHANSPVWPGYTPLHMLQYHQDREPSSIRVREMLQLLLDRGADVTSPSATGKTAVHVAYAHYSSLYQIDNYLYVKMLLRAQRDFSVNPKSIDGLTHFHVACGLNDLLVVEKFLRHAKIDVNQRVDYFADVGGYCRTAGCTPLHLAVSNRGKLAARLDIVDLLLKCGADVHAEDVDGNTPLNRAAESNVQKCQDLFERLARAGADVNTTDIFGKTPLEHLISKQGTMLGVVCKIVDEQINYFLKCGCHFNDYNRATGRGHLALALSRLSYEDMRDLIAGARINFPNAMKVVYKGRTAIHNVVSGTATNVSIGQYAALIDQLSRFDCNVDDQDEKGQTALHLAVHHQNVTAVCALIMVGADMSVRDSSDKVALAYNSRSCQCDTKNDDNYEDENDAEDVKCDHDVIYQAFLSYALKLKLSGYNDCVKLIDEYIEFNAYTNVDPTKYLGNDLRIQFNKSRNLKIGSSSITFGDFLFEFGAVIKYATMSAFNREAIDDFFSSSEIQSFSDKFSGMTSIIRFQYRKAVKRRNLMEASKNVLVMLTGYRLPDLCSEYILQLLRNFDLENLVASME